VLPPPSRVAFQVSSVPPLPVAETRTVSPTMTDFTLFGGPDLHRGFPSLQLLFPFPKAMPDDLLRPPFPMLIFAFFHDHPLLRVFQRAKDSPPVDVPPLKKLSKIFNFCGTLVIPPVFFPHRPTLFPGDPSPPPPSKLFALFSPLFSLLYCFPSLNQAIPPPSLTVLVSCRHPLMSTFPFFSPSSFVMPRLPPHPTWLWFRTCFFPHHRTPRLPFVFFRPPGRKPRIFSNDFLSPPRSGAS